jgi:hypothetical protein
MAIIGLEAARLLSEENPGEEQKHPFKLFDF